MTKNFEPSYGLIHPGKRWHLVYGAYAGVEQFAVDELQRMIQLHLPYVVQAIPADAAAHPPDGHLFLAGTPRTHTLIARLAGQRAIALPAGPQAYTVACIPSPWDSGSKVIVVAGTDEAGVLHGVEDFNTRVLGVMNVCDGPKTMRESLDGLPPFSFGGSPLIRNRGLWTWGYVIYDYRRFLDNMARLRMNMLTIWNETPPVNIREVIAYAHSRGIRVVLGFHWGWAMKELDLADARHVEKLKADVLDTYERDYAAVPHDGIYFQTLTETFETRIHGVPIAKLSCDMVNTVGGALLARHPDLSIQFGLHATSILDEFTYFENLDRRIVITWENFGSILRTGSTSVTAEVASAGQRPPDAAEVEATIAYCRKLAALRGKAALGLVPKGFLNLRWGSEFEKHGPFILGERSPRFIRERYAERRALWDQADRWWIGACGDAIAFFREMLAVGPESMTVTALVEDALFEEAIPTSVALLAHILWNPMQSPTEILSLAMSSYYRDVR